MENDEKDDKIESDDVEFVAEEESQNPAAAIKKLRERLKACEAEKQEYLDGWQRAKADFINARKDEAKAREEFLKFAKEAVLADFIPLADHFERAFAHKEAWEKVDKNWRAGIESIYTELLAIFKQNELAQVGKEGEKFEPNLHEPIGTQETDDKNKDETVAEVIDKGYRLTDKIIRPAKVKIYQLK
jgi:molecular chaperone GrpE